jgi:hypothetical protein
VRLLELAEKLRHHDCGRAGRRADPQRAGEIADAFRDDLVEHLLLEREQALRPTVEPEACLRRLYTTARPVEQLRPEALLEGADLERDGRLGDPELVGCLGERPTLHDGAEGGELTRIHKFILWKTLQYDVRSADMHSARVRSATNPFTFGTLAQDEAVHRQRDEILGLSAADMSTRTGCPRPRTPARAARGDRRRA